MGKEELFPFDVVKKCNDVLRSRRLGRPAFRTYRYGRTRKLAPPRQDTRKPHYFQCRQRNSEAFFRPQGIPGEGDAGLQSFPVIPPPVGDKVLSLLNTPEHFVGGRIHISSHLWQALSSDTWIHGVVNGNVLEFDRLPVQRVFPIPLRLSAADPQALDSAMLVFKRHKIVERCVPTGEQCFYSNVFPTPKKDGTVSVILSSRELNAYVRYEHFKMDSIADVINLIQPMCFCDY